MEKYIYDNSNGLQYELQEDYDIPCLVLPDTEERPIGIWGRKHQQYLREHRPIIYSDLVLSGKLYEQLKAQDQMAWVRAMNNIRNRAEEIVLNELIYGEDTV